MLIEELKEKLIKFTEKMDKNWTPAQYKYYQEMFEETYEESKKKVTAMQEIINDMSNEFDKITTMMAKMELYPHQLKQEEYNKKMLEYNTNLDTNDRMVLNLENRIKDLNISMTSLKNTSKYMPLDGPQQESAKTTLAKMDKDKTQLMNDRDEIQRTSGNILITSQSMTEPMMNDRLFSTENNSYQETKYLDYRYRL